MYEFIREIEIIIKPKNEVGGRIKERIFYLNGLLGMGPAEIVSNGYLSNDEFVAIMSARSENDKKAETERKVKKIKYLIGIISESLNTLLINDSKTRDSLSDYLSAVGFFGCVPELKISMDNIIDENTDPGTRLKILGYAYFSYKMKFDDNVHNSFLHTKDIFLKQYGVPLIPLIYGDYNSTFRVNSQMTSGMIPIKIEICAEMWPPMPTIHENTAVSDYFYLLVLAIGWDKFLRDAVVEDRAVWNGVLYRVRDHQPVIGDDQPTQQAMLSLQLTSYVAMLGSNYGLIHNNTNEQLQRFAIKNRRIDFADLLEKRWNDFSISVKFSSQVTEINKSQIEYVIASLKMNWPESVESSFIDIISNMMKHERENPFDLKNSKLANPLSANLIVHGMRDNQHVIVLQDRNKKKVGHGYVSLQASAAGFVSPYLDQRRSGVNVSNPDLLNAFYTESLQELGEIYFNQINIHGVFRDLVNFEVGMAASVYSDQVTVNSARESGNEVSGYNFVNNSSKSIFHFMNSISSREENADIWGCMMPLGLAALLSYLASDAGWKAVFEVSSEVVQKDHQTISKPKLKNVNYNK